MGELKGEGPRLSPDGSLGDFRDFANSLPQIVYSFLPGKEGLEFVNDRWLEYTGQSREEALSGFANDPIHPDDKERTLALWQRSLDEGISYEDEIRIRGKNGEYRWFLTRSIFLKNAAGEIVRWVGISTDINERKNSEEELRDSRERVRLATEATGMVTWEWDVVTDRVTLSESFASVYGLPALAGAAEGFALVFEEDKEAHLAKVQKTSKEGGSYFSEFRIRRPDTGQIVWLEERGVALLDKEGKINRLVGVTLDISERKVTEERLQRLQLVTAKLATALTTQDIMNVVFNEGLVSIGASGSVFAILNEAGDEFEIVSDKGYPAESTAPWRRFPLQAGIPMADVILSGEPLFFSSRAEVAKVYGEMLRRGKSTHEGWTILALQGRTKPLGAVSISFAEKQAFTSEDRSFIQTVIGQCAQALERTQLFEQVLEQRDLNATLTSNATQAIFMMDAKGYCTFMNPAAEAMLGFAFEEIRAKPLHDMIHHHRPDGRPYPMSECPIDRALPENFDIREHEDTFIRRNGEFFPVLVAASPIFKDGKPISTVVEVRDISERKQQEEAKAWLAAMVNASQDSIISYDLKGKVLTWTPGAEAMFGYSSSEIVGQSMRLLVGEDKQDEFTTLLAKLGRGEYVTQLETVRVRKRGERFHALVTLAPVRSNGGGILGVAAVIQDITERKRHEANLTFLADIAEDFSRLTSEAEIMQAIGARLAGHLELGGISFADVDEGSESVTVKYNWNASDVPQIVGTFRFADYMTEEFSATMRSGKTWVVNDTQHDERTDARATAAISVGAIVNVPYFQGGEWQGCFTAMSRSPREWNDDEITLIQEVTNRLFPRLERARAEERLQRSEANYRTLVQNISDYAIFMIDENGFITQWTEGAQSVKGYRSEEVLGQHLSMFYPLEELEADQPAQELAEAARTGRAEREGVRLKKGGERIFVNEIATAIRDTHGTLLGFTKISRDISERKHAETALKESEGRLQTMAENLPGGAVFIIDREMRYLLAEGEAFRGAGFMPSDFVGKTMAEALEPSLAKSYEPLFQAALQGESFDYEHQSHGHTYLTRGVPLRDQVGDIYAVLAVSYDITERKKTEEALRWFEAIVKSSHDAILSFDLGRKVLSWNPGAERMFGYKGEEIINETLSKLVEKEREGEQLELVEKLKRGELITQFETVRLRKSGETFDALLTLSPIKNERGEIVAATEIVQDITGRKATEEALRKSEEHFRLLVESATDYAIFTMDLQGLVTSWNKGAERVFGYSETEILGQSGMILFTPEDRAKGAHEEELQTALTQGRAADERYHLRKGGERFFASGVLTQLRHGNLEGFVKIARDLSERKKMEDALREADKRKDEFLAVLAHELRNPLAPIRTSVEILRRSKNQAVHQEARETIARQTTQMVHLIDDLLDVTRISQGRIKLQQEDVSLSEVVDLALEGSRTLIEDRQHELSVALPETPLWLNGDKTRLAQIVLNLLTNAAKYTPTGGKINLSAELQGDEVFIRVRDNGIGIPQDMLDKVFELFTRVERETVYQQEGLGIGLSLVKQLVELHGGDIKAESPGEGLGSTFTVRLPILLQESGTLEAVSEALAENVRRILVVDDYEPSLRSMAQLLEVLGHEVATASSGEIALEKLTKFKPDIILLDINMPGLSGYEVAARINEQPQYKDIMLVALTGYGQAEDVQRAKDAGFHHHLIKPVEIEKLEVVLSGA
jgi:PAS domain S-box-containing protein